MAGRNSRERASLIVTVLDEAATIDDLVASVAAQTCPPDEIVIVDGGSTDGTLDALQRWAARLPLRVLSAPGVTIARGRNIAIEAARNDLIAVTDAGVRLDPRWLESLLEPLTAEVDVVSGFFVSDAQTTFERAMGATVLPAVEDVHAGAFLPSSRSVLFRRAAWRRVGGYPEWLDYCEDLVFDLALRDQGCRFTFAPRAVAHFRPRGSLGAFFRQYYRYARGDGKADLWRGRHAIRYATYLIALLLLRRGRFAWLLLISGGLAYTRRPLQRLQFENHSPPRIAYAIALVPVIRFVGDVAKMLGYPVGVWWRWTSRSSS